MTAAQLATHTDGAVSCGTRAWRFRGRLQITVVVKAVFAIVPDGIATPAGPGEIVAEDRHRDGHPFRSVAAAGDLAPYLTRCDVVFVGHAHAPGGPAAAGAVRLGVSRDGQRLLDKTLHVYGDRGPSGAPEPFTHMPIVYERALGRVGAPNPIGTETPNLVDPADPQRPAGFGPISRLWPVRRHLVEQLEQLDRKTFEGPVAEIPEAMDWAYFQAAPPDQQIDPLRGGEWLVLDGLHPTRPRVQTCLPAVRGVARVELRGPGHEGGSEAAGAAVELVCDTLAIDGDRQTLTLSWRGHHEVPEGEAALAALTVLGALETPGAPVDWARIRSTAARGLPPAAPRVEMNGETVLTAPDQAAVIPPEAALPFGHSGVPARPPRIDATPWSAHPVRRVPVAAPGEPTLAPQPSPLRRDKNSNKTMALPVAQQEALAALPAVPFVRAARPVAHPEEDADTAELPPLHPSELFHPAVLPEVPPAPPAAAMPAPPAGSPWRVEAPPASSAPPAATPRPQQASPVKSELYAGFRSKKR